MQEKSDLTTLLPNSSTTTTRRPSLKFIFAPVQHNVPPPSTTNKIILDYLLYLSIQSRLKQAQIELLELTSPLQDKDKDAIQVRKQRWVATATKAEQDKNAVESIVAGILSSQRNKRPSFQIDSHFEQRLHLCQLTNLIFGRLDTSTSSQHVIHSSSSTRRRRRRHHHHHHHHHHHNDTDQDTSTCRWTHMIIPNYCRRHRLQKCVTCQDNNNKQSLPPGLVEAIPTFLKTSADMLRQTLETNSDDDDEAMKKEPLIFAGQKVMGGGMPPRWYDLFLELLTQAAIESYLCDMQTGLESIYEIFSYGDVEDEDEPDHHINNDDSLDDTSTTQQKRTPEDDEDDDDDDLENDWGIKAADHHLLFPKTRTMYLFKTQVREREKEFLVIEKDVSLHQHFAKLAKRYPLETFEKNIGEFIQMLHNTMAVPALDNKYDHHGHDESTVSSFDNNKSTSSESPSSRSVYKYPGDGSLLMPEIPDDESDDSNDDNDQDQDTNEHNKRRASVTLTNDAKKQNTHR